MRVKIPKIPFNDGDAWFQLSTKDKVYTLRTKRFKNRIHEVKSKYLPKKERMVVHLRFVKEIKIHERNTLIICEPLEALEPYVKESGFNDMLEWLQALQNFRIQIPEYPEEPRTFYLHKVTKIN